MATYLPLIAVGMFAYYWYDRRRADPSGGELSARSTELGFLPLSQLNTQRAAPPAPELMRALLAVRSGDWGPAAVLLSTTGENWELRTFYVFNLGVEAAGDDSWLLAWETARPDDPDAAVVRARSTVLRAGEVPGAARGTHPAGDRSGPSHQLLSRSRTEITYAAGLNPADPTPYITELATARGLRYPHDEMQRLWAEVTARAPHHYEAHFLAVQYWCAKGQGSDGLARDFAARAAADGPPGSLLSAFPLIAWYEAHSGGSPRASAFRGHELIARVDAALVDAAAAPCDHPRLAELRHLLAYFLFKQGRYEAALEQFRLVDGYVDALPWRYHDKGFYVAAREATVRRTG
ncbi:hypothetical protein [Streptomyces sp. NPDC051569]|uniref:hypothetical protein n=1 Tax=Streptomyces sp. NPDC051569 TaxID=3365661 RepID=UPI0037A95F27